MGVGSERGRGWGGLGVGLRAGGGAGGVGWAVGFVVLSEVWLSVYTCRKSQSEAAGGMVVKLGPCYRIDSNLNLSRALADFKYKELC